MRKVILMITVLIFTSHSNSQGWVQQNSGTTQHLRDVYFINQQTGYAVGGLSTGIVLKTTNGGTNWNQVNTGSNIISYSVFFINVQTGFITPPSITKTTDAGSNWTMSGASSCLDVFFLNNNEGYACGYTGRINKTTDGGNNWITQNSGVTHDLNSIFFINSVTGYAAGYYATEPNIFYRILRTTNGGNLWTIHQQGASQSTTQKAITFSDSITGYFIDGGSIYRSSNSGNNWAVVFTYNTLYAVNFPSPRFGFVVGDNGVILKTSDYGINWSPMISGVSNILYSVFFADTLVGYAVGHSGIIIKTTNGGVTFTEPIYTEIPNQFSLSQNYPNPFNPTTNFEFRIADFGFVNLTIYDVLGREVETLVNIEMKPGTYKADWNASNYPSGVYFYRLNTENFFDTKKMMLIK